MYSGFYSENYDSGAPEMDAPEPVEYYDLSTLDIELEALWADAPVIDEPAQITTEVYQFTFQNEEAA